MSVIVIGISHHTADLNTLERTVLATGAARELAGRLAHTEHVSETVVISTCNRTEVYAEVATFHGAASSISEELARATKLPAEQLRNHLYVHFEDRAVAHLFTVAAGMDSMAVGEAQILGQLRAAMRDAQDAGHIGSSLSVLMQQALRVGKRAHAETEIDTVSRSLVERSLQLAEAELGELSAHSAVVVGAGAMSGLAAHTLARAGVGSLAVVNRTLDRATRLAEATGAAAHDWAELTQAIAEADIVVSCTGALGHVVTPQLLHAAGTDRSRVLIDLALPRDIAPEAAQLPGVTLITLADLSAVTSQAGPERDSVRAVQDLVAAEVAEFLVARRAAGVIPTLTALRARSAAVVEAEMERLHQRSELGEAQEAAVRQTLHRVVEKILHAPTVRMKQLAGEEHGQDYTALMRTLFDLDPHESRVARIPEELM